MTLCEQLLDVYEDHNGLLSEDSRAQDRVEWLTPKLEKLLNFKAKFEDLFACTTPPPPQQDLEMPKQGDLEDCVSENDSGASKASKLRNVSVVSAKIKESQKLAELKDRATSLNRNGP